MVEWIIDVKEDGSGGIRSRWMVVIVMEGGDYGGRWVVVEWWR